MKNKELLIENSIYIDDNGKPDIDGFIFTTDFSGKAINLDISKFTDPIQMTKWEYCAYNYYGNQKCKIEKISTLEDLFGKEFHDRFFTKKNELLKEISLKNAENAVNHYSEILKEIKDYRPNPNEQPYMCYWE